MQLNELFDKASEAFTVTVDRQYIWEARAELSNGKTLKVMCVSVHGSEDLWELYFTVNGSFELTGDNNGIEVLGLVSSMLKRFLEMRDPKQIAMTAEEQNRANAYRRLFARALRGWKLIVVFEDGNNFFRIAAVNGSDFPVKQDPDHGAFISIAPTYYPGYGNFGSIEETNDLQDTPELRTVCARELEVAYKMAEENPQ